MKNLTNLLANLSALIDSGAREEHFSNDPRIKSHPEDLTSTLPPAVWKHLPNVEAFDVVTNELDPLINSHGAKRKLGNKIESRPLSRRLKACNRYLDIQQAVLVKMVRTGRFNQFWARSFMLLQRSKVLRLVALYKLNRNWYRAFKFTTVVDWLKVLNHKIETLDPRLDITRNYVEKVKPDGTKTWRPIGAPDWPDRMYLYLLSSFVTIFVQDYIGKYQHAFQPGKGVASALADLSDMKGYSYIYEFDLKQFFPGLNISFASYVLTKLGMPKVVTDFLYFVSQSYATKAKLPGIPVMFDITDPVLPLDETKEIYRKELDHLGLLFGNKLVSLKDFSMPSWLLTEEGFYRGKILLPIFEFIGASSEDTNLNPDAMEGIDMLHMFIEEDLGVNLSNATRIEKFYWYYVYRSRQQDALSEFHAFAKDLYKDGKPLAKSTKVQVDPFNNPAYQRDVNLRLQFSNQVGEWVKTHNLFDSSLPIENQGFPQGSALSPIFSIICFEYILYPFFEKFFEKLESKPSQAGFKWKIVAYADDFILLCNHKITDADITKIFNSSFSLEQMGIVFHPEKSGWIRKADQWTKQSFKFLGATYWTESGLWEGTPRSGGHLMMDQTKSNMVERYENRILALEKIINFMKWELSPSQVLDAWGFQEPPYSLLPEKLIRWGEALSLTEMLNFKAGCERAGYKARAKVDTIADLMYQDSLLYNEFSNGVKPPLPKPVVKAVKLSIRDLIALDSENLDEFSGRLTPAKPVISLPAPAVGPLIDQGFRAETLGSLDISHDPNESFNESSPANFVDHDTPADIAPVHFDIADIHPSAASSDTDVFYIKGQKFTRTSAFGMLRKIEAMEARRLQQPVATPPSLFPAPPKTWLESKTLIGFVLSRLHSATWEIPQYEWDVINKTKSWMDLAQRTFPALREVATLRNASSFAAHSMIGHLTGESKLRIKNSSFTQGDDLRLTPHKLLKVDGEFVPHRFANPGIFIETMKKLDILSSYGTPQWEDLPPRNFKGDTPIISARFDFANAKVVEPNRKS